MAPSSCPRGMIIVARRLGRGLAGCAAALLLLLATAGGVDAFVVGTKTTTTITSTSTSTSTSTASATTTPHAPAIPSCGRRRRRRRAGPFSRTRREPRCSRDATPLAGTKNSGADGSDASTGPKDDEDAAVVVLHLPANGVKVGALRFLLQMCVVGRQNHPVPNSWLTRSSDDSNNDIIVYYGDGTAALRVRVDESGLEFARMGERPSLPYLLQESVLLHGILDELENAALGGDEGDIPESKRLLRLADPGYLEEARSKLPARKLGS